MSMNMNTNKKIATLDVLGELKMIEDRIESLKKSNDSCEGELTTLYERYANLLYNDYQWFDQPFYENGRCGLKNVFGDVVIPAKFDDYSTAFRYDARPMTVPMCLNGGMVLVKTDGTGDIVKGTEYESIFKGPYACLYNMVKDNKCGYMTPSGHVVLDCVCDDIYEECNGVIPYEVNGKWGIIYDNFVVVPAKFDEIGIPEIDQAVEVKMGDEWGYIDANMEFTTDPDNASYVVPS